MACVLIAPSVTPCHPHSQRMSDPSSPAAAYTTLAWRRDQCQAGRKGSVVGKKPEQGMWATLPVQCTKPRGKENSV